jgi:hypothetical protein
MDSDLLAQQLLNYAKSGTQSNLELLSSSCSALQDAGTVLEDVISSVVVQLCVSRLVEGIQTQPLKLVSWNCLCFLASPLRYRGAARMLTEFSSSKRCFPMLDYCGQVACSGTERELQYCFTFVNLYIAQCDLRREEVYNITQLRTGLLNYLADRFADSSCDTQTEALRMIVRLLGRNVQEDSTTQVADPFLRDGALRSVTKAAVCVFRLGVIEEEAQMFLTTSAFTALWMVTFAVLKMVAPEKRNLLSEEVYMLSPGDMDSVNAAVYRILDGCRVTRLLHEIGVTLPMYGEYLSYVCGANAQRSHLLYMPPLNDDAKPMAQLLTECMMFCGEAHQEKAIMDYLTRHVPAIPEITSILHLLPHPPVRVAKDRRCALPDCDIGGTGLYNNMKKCTRCRAVYYCCKRHQELHWPQHRRTCVKVRSQP